MFASVKEQRGSCLAQALQTVEANSGYKQYIRPAAFTATNVVGFAAAETSRGWRFGRLSSAEKIWQRHRSNGRGKGRVGAGVRGAVRVNVRARVRAQARARAHGECEGRGGGGWRAMARRSYFHLVDVLVRLVERLLHFGLQFTRCIAEPLAARRSAMPPFITSVLATNA